MDLLIRPSLINSESSLLEIDSLMKGTDLSVAVFLSRNHIVLANSLFIKRWALIRTSFPRFSLSDYANKNALLLSGETQGRFWEWFSNPSPHPSVIDLPEPGTKNRRFLLRIPTETTSALDPIFIEHSAPTLPESKMEELLLLGRRLRTPARTLIRNVSDEIVIDHFFKDELALDSYSSQAQILLSKDPVWSPNGGFWRIQRTSGERKKLVAENVPEAEIPSIVPFRRIVFTEIPFEGYWADFPLLYNRAFLGKVRLFRPISKKRELPGLSSFQSKSQALSRTLFDIRKNLGDVLPASREPESGFLDRREALLLIEALIEESRITGIGFGLIGIRAALPNQLSLMIKVRSVLRTYDEVAHMTPQEYLLILPAMNPERAENIIERVRDMLLGMNQHQTSLVTFGWLSFPESGKGPMNLVRSVFAMEDVQAIQKKPVDE